MPSFFRATQGGNYDATNYVDLYINHPNYIKIDTISTNLHIQVGQIDISHLMLYHEVGSFYTYPMFDISSVNLNVFVDDHGYYFDYSGSSGSAAFRGGSYGDVLAGGNADDILYGRGGADTLTGGAGNDVFGGTASELSGDTITDFSGGDRVRLDGGETFEKVTLVSGGNVLEYIVSGSTYSLNLGTTISQATYTGTEISLTLPTISIDDVTQAEGSSGGTVFTFTVSLDVQAARDVTFDYSTAFNTATMDDFLGILSGSGTIADGDLSTTVTVQVVGDTAIEADETFVMNVSNVGGATMGDIQGRGTILNDDILPPNAAPHFTGPHGLSIRENQSAVASLTATDPDGDALTYNIAGGADSALFTINSKTGALSFLEAPDFEAPHSTDGTNIYAVDIRVSDGAESATRLFTVTVLDTAEVARFFNATTGMHFYTADSAERDLLIATNTDYVFEGETFSTAATGDGVPVHRFYNVLTGGHFYTANADEAASVRAELPEFSYEGEAFIAYADAQSGRQAVHRFYNVETKAHFYTSDEAERDNVLATLPQYNYEGVAFYVDFV